MITYTIYIALPSASYCCVSIGRLFQVWQKSPLYVKRTKRRDRPLSGEIQYTPPTNKRTDKRRLSAENPLALRRTDSPRDGKWIQIYACGGRKAENIIGLRTEMKSTYATELLENVEEMFHRHYVDSNVINMIQSHTGLLSVGKGLSKCLHINHMNLRICKLASTL